MDNLDLTPYSAESGDGNGKYELFAVSNHFGGMGGGHYTANAKVTILRNREYRPRLLF